ncbi:unnamed protein product [Protopolystoma xenopodis]|uniref:Uncharacterized protein n=1 Tax=Protopolystoma xenopodis TaxID=117903 RepID=A0A3S5ABG5_9PLAT|nr:unnamed protein product [Protopolystoma xenopodis]
MWSGGWAAVNWLSVSEACLPNSPPFNRSHSAGRAETKSACGPNITSPPHNALSSYSPLVLRANPTSGVARFCTDSRANYSQKFTLR